jgi:alkaline phosphatase D
MKPEIQADFEHGVASGDPLQDKVILWTRLTPRTLVRLKVVWEIATDNQFKQNLKRERLKQARLMTLQ